MIPFINNLVIACLWTFLFWDDPLIDFCLGFIVGFLLLSIYSMFISSLNYTRRLWGFIRFIPLFTYAFIKANLEVAYVILFVPNSKLKPSTFSYDVSQLSSYEILLLSHLISLTPGTITADISNDNSTILIHTLHYADPEQTQKEITLRLKNSLLRFTR